MLRAAFLSVEVSILQYQQFNTFRSAKTNWRQEVWLPQTDRASAFVVDRVKTFLTDSLITMQKLVAVSHTVCEYVTGPKNRNIMGSAFLGTGYGWHCIVIRYCTTCCYHTKFHRSRSNRFGVRRGGPKRFFNFLVIFSFLFWVVR